MPETDFSGNYLNADNTQDGDILLILEEGEYNEIEKEDGTKRKVLNIPVEVNGARKIWTPWTQDGKDFAKAFGKNSASWIGKKGKISHVKYKSYGQTKIGIEVKPVIEEKI